MQNSSQPIIHEDENQAYTIFGAFAIPLILIKFKQHDKYNFPAVAKKNTMPKGWEVPLNTSFPNIEADDDFITMEKTKELKTDIKISIASCFAKMNLSTDFKIPEFWYNIYHQDQGQEPHSHEGPLCFYWCGIYYNKNPSPTIFCKRAGPHDVHIHQVGYDEQSELGTAFSPIATVPATEGDIVLFPPYLEHYVPVQNDIDSDDKMRLTFSFNIMRNNMYDMMRMHRFGIE